MALYDALLLPWPSLPARAPRKAPRATSRSERRHPLPQPPEPPRWAGGLWALLRSRKAHAWEFWGLWNIHNILFRSSGRCCACARRGVYGGAFQLAQTCVLGWPVR